MAAFAVVGALLPLLFVLLSSSRAVHHGDYGTYVFCVAGCDGSYYDMVGFSGHGTTSTSI